MRIVLFWGYIEANPRFLEIPISYLHVLKTMALLLFDLQRPLGDLTFFGTCSNLGIRVEG